MARTSKHIWFWRFDRKRHDYDGRVAWPRLRYLIQRIPMHLHWAWLDLCDLIRPEIRERGK